MSTVDEADGGWWVNTKGAPDVLLERCVTVLGPDGEAQRLTPAIRAELLAEVERSAHAGCACWEWPGDAGAAGKPLPDKREDAERELSFVGLVALLDPPRADVAEAVARCYAAGIRIIVVTGDHGLTAAEVARRVGIAPQGARIVNGVELDAMREAELDRAARGGGRPDLRPHLAGGEAADRRCAARPRARRGHDRRRRQRRAGAAGRRHRRGDGPLWHRRRARGSRRWCSPTTTSRPSSPPSRRVAASTTTSANSSSTSSPTRPRRSSRSSSSRCRAGRCRCR